MINEIFSPKFFSYLEEDIIYSMICFVDILYVFIGITVRTLGIAKSFPGTRLYPINRSNPKTNIYQFHLQLELLFLLMHEILTYLLNAVDVLSIWTCDFTWLVLIEHLNISTGHKITKSGNISKIFTMVSDFRNSIKICFLFTAVLEGFPYWV